ncbi:sigma-70 family RNA polymerase sigma factor [Vibrio ezurae]|uniref:sigma-70 family RNA polymerase sigma factor n=1 Tax=Vibrio ezurae TaxID=252583 RepID=UPI0009FF7580
MTAWNDAEPSLYRWVLKQTNSPDETDDIMQEVFLKAMRNSERFCTLDDGKSWLFKMTKNYLIDTLRRRFQTVDLDDISIDKDITPAMVQLQRCLPKALTKLSDQERDVIEQCDLDNVTQKQYAEQKQLSLPAVKARLRRARISLRNILITECNVAKNQKGKVCCFKSYQVTD